MSIYKRMMFLDASGRRTQPMADATPSGCPQDVWVQNVIGRGESIMRGKINFDIYIKEQLKGFGIKEYFEKDGR